VSSLRLGRALKKPYSWAFSASLRKFKVRFGRTACKVLVRPLDTFALHVVFFLGAPSAPANLTAPAPRYIGAALTPESGIRQMDQVKRSLE
jgi:hypothetical protein